MALFNGLPVVGDGDGRLPQHAAGLGVDLVHRGRARLVLSILAPFPPFAAVVPLPAPLVKYPRIHVGVLVRV